MIQSFEHAGLKRFFETGSKAGIQPKHASRLELQLDVLNAAKALADLNVPGGDFHPLKGKLKDHWSISVNGNWRVTFPVQRRRCIRGGLPGLSLEPGGDMQKGFARQPVHPGRLIREFMGETISVTELAEHLRITRPNLSRILNERGGISAELALRLSESFNTTPDLWMNMQANYDLGLARANHSAVTVFPARQIRRAARTG